MKTNLRDSVSTLRLENCALVILRDRECNVLMYMVHYNLSTINRNRSSVLMVSVLFSTSAEERRFEPRSAETNELTMSVLVICPGGTPCLYTDQCFNELALYHFTTFKKSSSECWSVNKAVISLMSLKCNLFLLKNCGLRKIVINVHPSRAFHYISIIDNCLSFCTFSFRHCFVCSSSIYGF